MRDGENKGRIYVVRLDVSSEESIKTAAAEAGRLIGDRGLDVLFNNAAVVSLLASVAFA